MHGIIPILHMREVYGIYTGGGEDDKIISRFFFIPQFFCQNMYIFPCHFK